MAPLIACAAAIDFNFKDPKGVNNVVFKTDAPLESINGTGTGISGKVSFDPANPSSTQGKIILDAKSLRVPNQMVQVHFLPDMLLDTTKFPEITFEVTALKDVKSDGDVHTATAEGRMTIKGITKEMKSPVKLNYLKGKLKARQPGADGDLLVVRANFSVKRSDFNINAHNFEDKVSDAIDLSLSVAGWAVRP